MNLEERITDKINKNVKPKHIVLFYGIIMQVAFFSLAINLFKLITDYSLFRLIYFFVIIFVIYLTYKIIMCCQKLREKYGDITYYDISILEKDKNV